MLYDGWMNTLAMSAILGEEDLYVNGVANVGREEGYRRTVEEMYDVASRTERYPYTFLSLFLGAVT